MSFNRAFNSQGFVGHRPDKSASMGQDQFHSSCSALQNESLVEPAALGAGASLVVAESLEAIRDDERAATVAEAARVAGVGGAPGPAPGAVLALALCAMVHREMADFVKPKLTQKVSHNNKRR